MIDFNTQLTKPSEDRNGEILLYLKEKGTASIAEMAVQFAVSEMTVRRVLHKLADTGVVIRTPGGAMVAPSGSMEKSFLERSAKNATAKDAIGREAAKLVRDGETVVLDSGTTTRYIARYMASKHDVAVVTTSLAALEELAGSASVQVRLTGGVYRRSSHDLSGNAVVDTLAGVHADKVGDEIGPLQDRLPFADGHDPLGLGERQQLAKAPDAAEAERIGPVRPLRLELAQGARRLQAVPVVRHVE